MMWQPLIDTILRSGPWAMLALFLAALFWMVASPRGWLMTRREHNQLLDAIVGAKDNTILELRTQLSIATAPARERQRR